MNDNLKILFLSIIFSIIIFIILNLFWINNDIKYIEKNFMEAEIEEKLNYKKIENIKQELWEKQDIEQSKKDKEENKEGEKIDLNMNSGQNNKDKENKYNILTFPYEYENEIKRIIANINISIDYKDFIEKIDKIELEYHKEMIEVRGKMKDWHIQLFWAHNMWWMESLSVFIHEFAHYLDLYYLKNWDQDISNDFYSISWNNTKERKIWQESKDFVSWYSMTNKYEDFAETFTYYVLHNDDFLIKAKKSEYLGKKYDFFRYNFFKNEVFYNQDFWGNTVISNYYRDITKIKYSLKKFLQYIEN